MRTLLTLITLLFLSAGKLSAQYRILGGLEESLKIDTVARGELVQLNECTISFVFAVVEDTFSYRRCSGNSFVVPDNVTPGSSILLTCILCDSGQEIGYLYNRLFIVE